MNHPAFDDFDLSSLRVTTVSAAAIPVSLIRDLESVLGFEVVLSGYGRTEATAIVTVSRPSDDRETVAHTAGPPFDDVEVKAVDALGNDLPAGSEGELLVRGYNVMQGYWREPEQTAATITADGWLRTGDIGIVDARGYVKITDRMKDMFIVGGFNAYPAEIEDLLTGFDKIQHVAVIGVPDERMGEVGAAFVVPTPGTDLTEAEVIAYAREHLANYKVPREVHIVGDLPRNASMKVLKHVLKEERLREVSPG
jgi:acyl-CoA synthetase (AMP-forming)/AMP-acid ligase II